MSKITNAEVIEMLDKVVAGREDYVYEYTTINGRENTTCMYSTPEGAPSCIVGHLLHDNLPEYFRKVSESEYLTNDAGDVYASAGIRVYDLPNISEIFDTHAIEALGVAQEAQDWGRSWGKAVERAAAH